jgi:hypothetical protein
MLFQLLALAQRVAWVPVAGWGLRRWCSRWRSGPARRSCPATARGLLVGQDIDAALRAHMKTAGGSRLREMDASAFLAQADDYAATYGARDSIAKLLNLVGRSHPFAVSRANELRSWIVDGSYQRILDGEYPSRVDDDSASLRDEVAETLRGYRAKAETSRTRSSARCATSPPGSSTRARTWWDGCATASAGAEGPRASRRPSSSRRSGRATGCRSDRAERPAERVRKRRGRQVRAGAGRQGEAGDAEHLVAERVDGEAAAAPSLSR